MKYVFTLIIALVFNTPLLAATTSPQSLLPESNDLITSSFRVIWGLLIVLGIILLLYGLLRKRFSLLSSLPDKEIHVLEIKPLMGKKAICLVEVRGTEYLLGISESQISKLATLPPKKTPTFQETLQAESGEAND
jgi:flagellar protein FliO/FliZ